MYTRCPQGSCQVQMDLPASPWIKGFLPLGEASIALSFAGVGSRGLDFISPSLSCINTKLTQIGEDFCGLDVNTPLGGELPVVQEPVLTFDSHLTAITATSTYSTLSEY